MARNKPQPEEEIIDLTELIESGDKPEKKSVAAPADDDFESLLAQSEAGDGRPAAPRKVDPDEKLDMSDMGDIDDLLESLDIPPQPGERQPDLPPAEPEPPAPPVAKDEDMGADLDSVLDDLLGTEPEAAAPRKASSVPVEMESPDADLDALLDEDAAQPMPPKKNAVKQASADFDADLDNILDSFEEKEPKSKPAAQPKSKPATASADASLDADLDSILAEMDEPAAGAPESPASKSALETPAEDFELPGDLDALIDETPPPAGVGEASHKKGEHVQHELADTPGFLSSRPPTTEIVEAQAVPKDMIASICQGILATQTSHWQQVLQDLSRQIGGHAAHLEDLSRNVTDLSKRLFACESRLGATRARISAMEKSVSSSLSLEDLFREGSSTGSGFANLIAAAVSNALKGTADKGQADAALQQALENMATVTKNIGTRLQAVEDRQNEIEQQPGENPELAANLENIAQENQKNLALAAELGKRLDELEAKLNTGEDSQVDERLQALDDAGAAIEARLETMEARLAATENLAQRLDELAGSESKDDTLAAEFGKRLDELEAKLNADGDSSVDERLQALDDAGAAIEARLETMEARLAATENLAQRVDELAGSESKDDALAAELGKRLDELEAKFNADGDSGVDERLQALDNAGAAIEARLHALEAGFAATENLAQRVDELAGSESKGDALSAELGKRLDELEAKFNAGGDSSVDERLQALDNAGAAIEARLHALETGFATTENLAKRMDEFVSHEDKSLEQAEALARRLDGLEARLDAGVDAELDGRLSALDKIGEESASHLQTIESRLEKIEQGVASNAPLVERLESLAKQEKDSIALADAIGKRLDDLEARLCEPDADINAHLKRLSTGERSAHARMDSLEKRLDDLEPNFNVQVEKAAATAVARILHEEIRRLTEGN